jgi:hypothetical protein
MSGLLAVNASSRYQGGFMPISSVTAINRVRARIGELHTASSLSHCEKLHADVTGYCRALLDCGVIDENQWHLLTRLANIELAAWMPAYRPSVRLPGWTAKDYE